MSDTPKRRRGLRPKDLVPRWYMDLDANVKSLISGGTVLAGVIPLMILAWHGMDVMHSRQHQLNALLDSGTATKAQILAVTDKLHVAIRNTFLPILIAPIYGSIVAMSAALIVPGLTADWLNHLSRATKRAAEG